MRNQRGITLIALVITIIVLLILAGVSIAMLTGDNGILTKADDAKEKTAKGEVADKINLAINAEFANLLDDGEMSGHVEGGVIAEAEAVRTANGLDSTYKVTPGTSIKGDMVLKIESTTYTDLVGEIKYNSTPESGESKGYEIVKAEVK